MATSVKMDEETKTRLERLQAEIRLRTGRKVTQQEVLERLVDEAFASRDEVVDSFRETRVPVSEEERAAFHEGIISSGHETAEDDIDDILYG